MSGTNDIVFLFDVDNTLLDNDQIQADLAARQIVCAVRHGHLRFAPHVYNTPSEVERILESLP